MIVSEDNAMLNTGIFFARSSSWASQLLQRIWGRLAGKKETLLSSRRVFGMFFFDASFV